MAPPEIPLHNADVVCCQCKGSTRRKPQNEASRLNSLAWTKNVDLVLGRSGERSQDWTLSRSFLFVQIEQSPSQMFVISSTDGSHV